MDQLVYTGREDWDTPYMLALVSFFHVFLFTFSGPSAPGMVPLTIQCSSFLLCSSPEMTSQVSSETSSPKGF